MNTNTSSYNNNPSLKIALVAEMKAHIEADRLVKGTYGKNDVAAEDFRGCSVGCSIVSVNKLTGKKIEVNDHNALASAIGLPGCGWLTRLQDYFFEYLPGPDHQQWSLDFLEAIPVGVSVEKIQLVRWKFLTPVLTDTLGLDSLPENMQSVVARVRDLCARAEAGDMPPSDEWDEAYEAARAARAATAAFAAARAADVIDAAAYFATAAASYAAAYYAADTTRKWASLLLNLLRATQINETQP